MPVLTGEAFAILSLLAMVIVAFAILRRVTDTPRDWDALGAAATGVDVALPPATGRYDCRSARIAPALATSADAPPRSRR